MQSTAWRRDRKTGTDALPQSVSTQLSKKKQKNLLISVSLTAGLSIPQCILQHWNILQWLLRSSVEEKIMQNRSK